MSMGGLPVSVKTQDDEWVGGDREIWEKEEETLVGM